MRIRSHEDKIAVDNIRPTLSNIYACPAGEPILLGRVRIRVLIWTFEHAGCVVYSVSRLDPRHDPKYEVFLAHRGLAIRCHPVNAQVYTHKARLILGNNHGRMPNRASSSIPQRTTRRIHDTMPEQTVPPHPPPILARVKSAEGEPPEAVERVK
jgi:hypothetical protein